MREIKFRAWDKIGKVMVDDLCMHQTAFNVDVPRGTVPLFYSLFHNPNIIPMQYTGLKDKNGKEIYEGDVFKTDNDCIGVIRWDEAQFVASIIDPDGMGGVESLFYAVGMNIEVIGNIYENPELLEAK